MKNERGASLVLVMLISLIFVTLGLTIFSVSLQGTGNTTVRENDVITSQDAIHEMTKVLNDFSNNIKKDINGNLKKRSYLTTGIYESDLQNKVIHNVKSEFSSRFDSATPNLLTIE